jgi:hypothetical protein
VEIEADLPSPGLVILEDQHYPGWQLYVETAGQGRRRVQIVPIDNVFRAAHLPAGGHRLIYRYRPASFLWGASITTAAWLTLLTGLLVAGIPVRREVQQSGQHVQSVRETSPVVSGAGLGPGPVQ